jgi:RHS repeat-associated protein
VSEAYYSYAQNAWLSRWYHYGPQGETRYLTDSAGNVADTYTYAAYGLQMASTGTDPNPYRFGGSVGYYSDPMADGLVLCGQRWYSPAYARWLSRDPVGYAGGANLYAYCGGDPVNGVDPSGTLTKANFWDAWNHWADKTGTPIAYRFADVDTRVPVANKLSSSLYAGCPSGTSQIDMTFGYETTGGWDKLIVGGISLHLVGTLTVKGHSWAFDGKLFADPDTYTFHSRAHGARRPGFGDIGNAIGGARPGKPFLVYMTGYKPVHDRGTF